jgi:hypothetical protein
MIVIAVKYSSDNYKKCEDWSYSMDLKTEMLRSVCASALEMKRAERNVW